MRSAARQNKLSETTGESILTYSSQMYVNKMLTQTKFRPNSRRKSKKIVSLSR